MKMKMQHKTIIFVAFWKSVFGFWRLPCENPVVSERGDPIITPGAISYHTHTVMGATGFGLDSSFKDLQDSTCTSCIVTEDLSAYWVAQLYFQWANGSFSSVDTTGGALIYYLHRSHKEDRSPIETFPEGFKMVSGNPFKRSFDPEEEGNKSNARGWNCLGSKELDPNGEGKTVFPYIPHYNCPNGLRQEVRMPSCWDGENLDSDNHHSHVAYSDGESGPCPSTHPRRFMTLFYEVMWSIDPWEKYRKQAMNTSQPFVLAQGDGTGYGTHADFQNGWNIKVLQDAIDTCTASSGVIEECDKFTLLKRNQDNKCRRKTIIDEVVLGTLDELPGCNPVTYGPEDAKQCDDGIDRTSVKGVGGTGGPISVSEEATPPENQDIEKNTDSTSESKPPASQAATSNGEKTNTQPNQTTGKTSETPETAPSAPAASTQGTPSKASADSSSSSSTSESNSSNGPDTITIGLTTNTLLIILGVVVLVVGLAIILCLIRRRHKKRHQRSHVASDSDSDVDDERSLSHPLWSRQY